MQSFSETIQGEIRDRIGVIRVNNPPVNALSWHVRDGLYDAFRWVDDSDDIDAAILICDGQTFIAGADIREIGGNMKGRNFLETLAMIENASKPVVAAIHGTALGGGLETALTCHYRVAIASAQFGLPEVKLGLLPGAGGTQRLPRVVGAEIALDMMVNGNPIGATAALASGLIDQIVDDLEAGALAFARQLIAKKKPLLRVRDLEDKVSADRAQPDLFDRFRKSVARRVRGFHAPEAIIQCVEDAVHLDFDAGLAGEQRRFAGLLADPQSAAQRYYFFAERKANKIPGVETDTPTRPIASVGVIGAGTMGGGITMNFINRGIPVTLVETKEEALQRGLATIRKNYERSADRLGLSKDDIDALIGKITPSLEMKAMADCDLIIEAVYENLDLKKEIFTSLDGLAKPGAILATNTSALDVNAIAQATARPQDVVGLHFFSPANIMKLVEIVRGDVTDVSVLKTAMNMCRKIGKVAVVSGVCHGFIGNRILAQRQQQAQKMILEGCMPWDVDRVIYDFGLPMGPFAMSDLAGLDIGWNPKTSSGSTLREQLCEMDRRGQKTGAGYYDYNPDTRAASPSPVVEELIQSFSAQKGITRRAYSDDEILARCIFPMINEGAKIIEEGISARPSDIDVVWVNGYGWPVYRGGPMFYGDQVGLSHVLETLEKFQAADGDDFWTPSPLLVRLVKEGKSFADLNG